MSIYDSLYTKYIKEANDYASSFNIEPSTAHDSACYKFRDASAIEKITSTFQSLNIA